MNHPQTELPLVAKELAQAKTVQAQHKAIERYFAPDAGFIHPLCSVPRVKGEESIELIKGIYEWYRDMSPDIDLEIESVVYDQELNVAYLQIAQTFHIFFSPFNAAPARLLVKITLEKNNQDNKYYIAQQEDYYQPEDIFRLVLPFLAPLIITLKQLTSRVCGYSALAFAVLRNVMHVAISAIGTSNGSTVKTGTNINGVVDSE